MRIHFVVNSFRPAAIEATRDTVAWLRAVGVTTGVESDVSAMIEAETFDPSSFDDADLVVAMGGDGTLIRSAHLVGDALIPILGVNLGRFGFACAATPENHRAYIQRYLDGEAAFEDRAMVQTQLVRGGKAVVTLHSLNEAAVQRAATNRMLTFDVTVDEIPLAHYPADGVMISTPTGSTAYNLSAGGPIVHPRVNALILSAIMPHTLAARSLVLSSNQVVRISMQTRGDAILSCDGLSRMTLLSGDEVIVSASPRKTRLLTVTADDFLTKVSERLKWSSHWRGPEEDEC